MVRVYPVSVTGVGKDCRRNVGYDGVVPVLFLDQLQKIGEILSRYECDSSPIRGDWKSSGPQCPV